MEGLRLRGAQAHALVSAWETITARVRCARKPCILLVFRSKEKEVPVRFTTVARRLLGVIQLFVVGGRQFRSGCSNNANDAAE
jgi:hypothetical protein